MSLWVAEYRQGPPSIARRGLTVIFSEACSALQAEIIASCSDLAIRV